MTWNAGTTTKSHTFLYIAIAIDSSKDKPKNQLWICIIIAELYCVTHGLSLSSVLLLWGSINTVCIESFGSVKSTQKKMQSLFCSFFLFSA